MHHIRIERLSQDYRATSLPSLSSLFLSHSFALVLILLVHSSVLRWTDFHRTPGGREVDDLPLSRPGLPRHVPSPQALSRSPALPGALPCSSPCHYPPGQARRPRQPSLKLHVAAAPSLALENASSSFLSSRTAPYHSPRYPLSSRTTTKCHALVALLPRRVGRKLVRLPFVADDGCFPSPLSLLLLLICNPGVPSPC
jgi:hypothetical protein